MSVTILDHALIQHKLTIMRDKIHQLIFLNKT